MIISFQNINTHYFLFLNTFPKKKMEIDLKLNQTKQYKVDMRDFELFLI